jgi:hypothetical protein
MKYLVLLFLFTACFNQPTRDCKTVKTGQFTFSFEIDKKTETSTFTRLDSLQIETFRGKTDTSSVRWINDCEFVLEKINPKSITDRKKIHIKIVETTAEGYQFNYGYVGETLLNKGFAKQMVKK